VRVIEAANAPRRLWVPAPAPFSNKLLREHQPVSSTDSRRDAQHNPTTRGAATGMVAVQGAALTVGGVNWGWQESQALGPPPGQDAIERIVPWACSWSAAQGRGAQRFGSTEAVATKLRG
jgi:hypothetical protein